MNIHLERLRKLEHCLIPEIASRYICARDIKEQSELYLKLYHLHLEAKEIRHKYVRRRQTGELDNCEVRTPVPLQSSAELGSSADSYSPRPKSKIARLLIAAGLCQIREVNDQGLI